MSVRELTQRVHATCEEILLNKKRTDSVSTRNTQQMIQNILNDISKVRETDVLTADDLTADVLTKTCMYKKDMDMHQQDKTYLKEYVPGRTLSSKVAPIGGRKRRTKRHRSKKL
jgi:hypothetical protein